MCVLEAEETCLEPEESILRLIIRLFYENLLLFCR